MTQNKDPKLTDEFYDYILSVKKDCAKRMKSKTHSEQLEKFVDTIWLEGHKKETIIHAMIYSYGVTHGYAETFVNCLLNMSDRG